MLYLGIDQHRKQLTVNMRNEQGDAIVRRQVSTEWERVRAFLADVRQQAGEEGFVAIVEVCGFNDWLLKLLNEYGCRRTILIQPEKQSKKKTDRRDASALSEVLWVNRERLLTGKPVRGVRCVEFPSEREGQQRQLTQCRRRLGQERTRTINKVKRILRKHNLPPARDDGLRPRDGQQQRRLRPPASLRQYGVPDRQWRVALLSAACPDRRSGGGQVKR